VIKSRLSRDRSDSSILDQDSSMSNSEESTRDLREISLFEQFYEQS